MTGAVVTVTHGALASVTHTDRETAGELVAAAVRRGHLVTVTYTEDR